MSSGNALNRAREAMPTKKCLILVPVAHHIDPPCEEAC